MKKYYVITNEKKDPDMAVTNTIQDYLKTRGHSAVIQLAPSARSNGEHNFIDAKTIPDDIECIIVIGGDGTLLRAARDTVEKGIPLLGVNMGTLGYLAEIDKDNILPALDKLCMEQYSVEKRMMLRGSVYRGSKRIMEDIALNDIVIGRNGRLRIINLNIYVNDEFLNSYGADGVIVSTPTGSTGYSLSAGGPIVAPQAYMILLTPIAAHTLNTRSIVLPGESKIEVQLGPGRRTQIEHAEVSFDGDAYVELQTDDRIVIEKAQMDVRIVKISNISFLEVLRAKMGSH